MYANKTSLVSMIVSHKASPPLPLSQRLSERVHGWVYPSVRSECRDVSRLVGVGAWQAGTEGQRLRHQIAAAFGAPPPPPSGSGAGAPPPSGAGAAGDSAGIEVFGHSFRPLPDKVAPTNFSPSLSLAVESLQTSRKRDAKIRTKHTSESACLTKPHFES